MHFFSSQALPATPWKNGGGTTQEVVCWPQGAGLDSFEWRISIAHIAQSGPFSAFAGIDRVITLLSGDGVHLHSPDGAINHRVEAGAHATVSRGKVQPTPASRPSAPRARAS